MPRLAAAPRWRARAPGASTPGARSSRLLVPAGSVALCPWVTAIPPIAARWSPSAIQPSSPGRGAGGGAGPCRWGRAPAVACDAPPFPCWRPPAPAPRDAPPLAASLGQGRGAGASVAKHPPTMDCTQTPAAEAYPPAAALTAVPSGTPIRTHAGRRMVTVHVSPGPATVMRPPAATAMHTACPASSGACHVCRMHPLS